MVVSPLLLTWVGLSLVCLVVAVWTSFDSQADRVALRTLPIHMRPENYNHLKRLADHNLRSSLEHTFVQAVFLTAGLRSVFNPAPAQAQTDIGAILLVVGFMLAELGLTAHTLVDAKLRHESLR